MIIHSRFGLQVLAFLEYLWAQLDLLVPLVPLDQLVLELL